MGERTYQPIPLKDQSAIIQSLLSIFTMTILLPFHVFSHVSLFWLLASQDKSLSDCFYGSSSSSHFILGASFPPSPVHGPFTGSAPELFHHHTNDAVILEVGSSGPRSPLCKRQKVKWMDQTAKQVKNENICCISTLVIIEASLDRYAIHFRTSSSLKALSLSIHVLPS